MFANNILDSISSSNPLRFSLVELHKPFQAIDTSRYYNVDLSSFLSLPEVYVSIQDDLSPLSEIVPSIQVPLSFRFGGIVIFKLPLFGLHNTVFFSLDILDPVIISKRILIFLNFMDVFLNEIDRILC
jgi:hypothetical protein